MSKSDPANIGSKSLATAGGAEGKRVLIGVALLAVGILALVLIFAPHSPSASAGSVPKEPQPQTVVHKAAEQQPTYSGKSY